MPYLSLFGVCDAKTHTQEPLVLPRESRARPPGPTSMQSHLASP